MTTDAVELVQRSKELFQWAFGLLSCYDYIGTGGTLDKEFIEREDRTFEEFDKTFPLLFAYIKRLESDAASREGALILVHDQAAEFARGSIISPLEVGFVHHAPTLADYKRYAENVRLFANDVLAALTNPAQSDPYTAGLNAGIEECAQAIEAEPGMHLDATAAMLRGLKREQAQTEAVDGAV